MASLVKNYKVLVVKIKSATLKAKQDKGKIYAYAYVQPETRLRTKVYRSHTARWDDKFVFSVPECSLGNQGSFLYFKVFKKGLLVGDSLIGIAKCDVAPLVTKHLEHLTPRSDLSESFLEDPRYPNMYEEMRKECFEEEDDPFEYSKMSREEEKKEFKAKARVEILKGLEKKGVLDVELEMGGGICCLGKLPWKNMAMPYDAFLGAIQANKSTLHWVCVGSATI